MRVLDDHTLLDHRLPLMHMQWWNMATNSQNNRSVYCTKAHFGETVCIIAEALR